MNKFSLVRENLPMIRHRLAALTPDSRRRWGALEPAPLLRHLRAALEMSLGDFECPDGSNFFTRSFLVRWLVLEVLSWPKGKIKVPEQLTPTGSGSLEEELRLLEEALDRFVSTAEQEPERMANHPLFGPQPLSRWARFHGRHLEHHFQQYGL